MKQSILIYLKKPQTILALVIALMAQLIFGVIWMTGYKGVLERIDHLQIAVVNKDDQFGEKIVMNLQDHLPFKMTIVPKSMAVHDLKRRKVHLILVIPKGFGKSLSTPDSKAKLSYLINESNPQLTKSVMQTVITKMTDELNHNAAIKGTQAVLQQLKLPSEQASQIALNLFNKVGSEVQSLHHVNGMENQMLPMMLVLACFVGAMLLGMNFHQVSEDIGPIVSKWHHFVIRLLHIFISALIISLAGSSLIALLGGQMASGFSSFWLFHFLTMLTFLFFAQIVLMIFGRAGMFLNMAFLSLQLVTSGTVVPRQMLSAFYLELGKFFPATYSVEGIMNLQFGGINTSNDVKMLTLMLGICILIAVFITLFKQEKDL